MNKLELEELAELLMQYHDEEMNGLPDRETYPVFELVQEIKEKAELR